MPEKEKSTDWGAITKWLVVGVVLVLVIVLFKKPIERLLDRTGEVTVDAKSGKFSLKTSETAIGDVKVSAEMVTPEQAGKIGGDTMMKDIVDDEFMLSWPKTSWKKDDSGIVAGQFPELAGSEKEVLMFCRQKHVNTAGFNGGLYVASVALGADANFEESLAAIRKKLETEYQARFLTYQLDLETKGATFVFTYQANGTSLYQVRRYAYANGKLARVAGIVPADDRQSQEEIRTIINSFRLVGV